MILLPWWPSVKITYVYLALLTKRLFTFLGMFEVKNPKGVKLVLRIWFALSAGLNVCLYFQA